MRIWFGGPRVMGIRPGISLGKEDFVGSGIGYAGARKTQRTPGNQMDGGFVYAIRGDHNLVKIGVSQNPNARLAAMRTASAFPLELCFVGACQTSGIEIEQEAHRLLEAHRTNGEWFDVSTEMATAAIFGAAAKLGQKIISCPPNMVNHVIALSTGQANEIPNKPSMAERFTKTMVSAILYLFLFSLFAAVSLITFALIKTSR